MIVEIFRKLYILVYLCIFRNTPLYYNRKEIVLTDHAIRRAFEREIAYPEQVYNVLRMGKVVKFGRRNLKFVKRSKKGSIICVGEEVGDLIVIKTIERGN